MKPTALCAEQLNSKHAIRSGAIGPNAVITGMHLEDGSYHVLSRYGDSVWILPDNLFPASLKDCQKKLNFSRVPAPFQETMRFCTARYILAGIEGRKYPRGSTLTKYFKAAVNFLDWLHGQNVARLSDVTPLTAQQYVKYCLGLKGRKHKRISGEGLVARFSAVETLHALSQQSRDPMQHPWPESSAPHFAGLTGHGNRHGRKASTEIIPDDILSPLFQSATEWLDLADEIIYVRDQVGTWRSNGRGHKFTTSRLKKLGWTLGEVRSAERHLRSACICIILTTSGIRVSELLSLENNCTYKTLDDQNEPFHWIRGTTYKTGVKSCEWMVTEITHCALAVVERLARPLQTKLAHRISDLESYNPSDPEITRLSKQSERLFLGYSMTSNNHIRTLSESWVVDLLNDFAAQCELDWHFTTHQFRRTFAVYAAHSAFGDLRYLRDHFKHWSLDMTGLYAMSRRQDAELYDEVGMAALSIKTNLLEHWLEPDAILTGGAADPIRAFRAKNRALATKEDRVEMAETISPLVHLRGTGVGWCTADTGGCNGGQAVEKTRCADCINAVIDESHRPVWQGIYAQQLELRELTDIGPGGTERVERDLKRCKAVLKELGATEEDLANVET